MDGFQLAMIGLERSFTLTTTARGCRLAGGLFESRGGGWWGRGLRIIAPRLRIAITIGDDSFGLECRSGTGRRTRSVDDDRELGLIELLGMTLLVLFLMRWEERLGIEGIIGAR